jgi:hypothetical protein
VPYFLGESSFLILTVYNKKSKNMLKSRFYYKSLTFFAVFSKLAYSALYSGIKFFKTHNTYLEILRTIIPSIVLISMPELNSWITILKQQVTKKTTYVFGQRLNHFVDKFHE